MRCFLKAISADNPPPTSISDDVSIILDSQISCSATFHAKFLVWRCEDSFRLCDWAAICSILSKSNLDEALVSESVASMAEESLISRLIKAVTKGDISKEEGSVVFLADCLKALRQKSADLHGYKQIQAQADLVENLINAATIPVAQLKQTIEDFSDKFAETDGEIVFALMRTTGGHEIVQAAQKVLAQRNWSQQVDDEINEAKSKIKLAIEQVQAREGKWFDNQDALVACRAAKTSLDGFQARIQKNAAPATHKETYYSLRDLAQLRV